MRPSVFLRYGLPALLLVTACASSRMDERAVTEARLLGATTPAARVAAVAGRFRDAGLAPLARGRFAFGTPPVVAAIVPGHDPILRTELVVLAASLDGPEVADVLEAGRLLMERQPDNEPRRSVLVAFWPSGQGVEAGLASIAAVPVWTDSSRVATVVVGTADGPRDVNVSASDPATVVQVTLDIANRPPAVAADTVAGVPR